MPTKVHCPGVTGLMLARWPGRGVVVVNENAHLTWRNAVPEDEEHDQTDDEEDSNPHRRNQPSLAGFASVTLHVHFSFFPMSLRFLPASSRFPLVRLTNFASHFVQRGAVKARIRNRITTIGKSNRISNIFSPYATLPERVP